MSIGIILYGPPGSGKSSIGKKLETLDSKFHVYRKLKIGPNSTFEYLSTTASHLNQLREANLVISEICRYNSIYIIEKPGLQSLITSGIPIVHAGQPEVVDELHAHFPDTHWISFHLTCSRKIAIKRLKQRGVIDLSERMRVWDNTASLPTAQTIDTSCETLDQSANRIIVEVAKVMDAFP